MHLSGPTKFDIGDPVCWLEIQHATDRKFCGRVDAQDCPPGSISVHTGLRQAVINGERGWTTFPLCIEDKYVIASEEIPFYGRSVDRSADDLLPPEQLFIKIFKEKFLRHLDFINFVDRHYGAAAADKLSGRIYEADTDVAWCDRTPAMEADRHTITVVLKSHKTDLKYAVEVFASNQGREDGLDEINKLLDIVEKGAENVFPPAMENIEKAY